MVEFAILMAYVNVEIMLLEIGVKSNRPIMATVILIITGLNLSMMVVTAAKVHAVSIILRLFILVDAMGKK